MAQFFPFRSVSSIPVPTPCETFSFLENDDAFLSVTPDKTLSSRSKPKTESLKEGSFLAEDDKYLKSRVQFSRSVSVFHFSPDQTFNTDENSQESFDFYDDSPSPDDPNFDPATLATPQVGVQNFMKKTDYLDAKVEQKPIVNRRLTMAPNFDYDDDEDLETDEDSGDESPHQSYDNAGKSFDSPIITDVHFYDDEDTWEEEEKDSIENISPRQLVGNHSTKEIPSQSQNPRQSDNIVSTKLEPTDAKSVKRNLTSNASTAVHDNLNKVHKDSKATTATTNCPDDKINKGQVLVRPALNTTFKYSLDVEKLRRRSFEKDVLKNGKLKDQKMMAKIESKALSELNIADDNRFTDLVSVDVDEKEVLRKVVEEKLSKVRREKAAKIEDKITRRPDILDFYNESYFILEPSCLPTDYSTFSLPRPKLKAAGTDRSMDLYRHQRMWEGLP